VQNLKTTAGLAKVLAKKLADIVKAISHRRVNLLRATRALTQAIDLNPVAPGQQSKRAK
jgi:hypothetical protein